MQHNVFESELFCVFRTVFVFVLSNGCWTGLELYCKKAFVPAHIWQSAFTGTLAQSGSIHSEICVCKCISLLLLYLYLYLLVALVFVFSSPCTSHSPLEAFTLAYLNIYGFQLLFHMFWCFLPLNKKSRWQTFELQMI